MASSKLSDEELLGDNPGAAIYNKNYENELIGDDGEIDEDALLGVDDAGGKFSNDMMHSVTTRHFSRVHGPSHQVVLVDEQAFVFDKAETADLEDELNIAGEDEGQFSMGIEQRERSAYHDARKGSYSNDYTTEEGTVTENQHLDYSENRMVQSGEEEMAYVNVAQDSYEDGRLYVGSTDVNYSAIDNQTAGVDSSSVELGYEQPIEQEGQIHLEYHHSGLQEITDNENLESTANSEQYGSESESDEESSRHNRGRFTSERTGVISLTSVSAREAIPDKLEINDEQAAQIEQFLSNKTTRGNRPGHLNRQSVHSRLGARPQLGPSGLLPAPRPNMLPRGVFVQQARLGGQFQNNLSVTFPGAMNQRGPFINRMINERSLYPLRFQGQRAFFQPGGPFPMAPFHIPPPQRFPFHSNNQGRFSSVPVQQGQFVRPGKKMPQPLIPPEMGQNISSQRHPSTIQQCPQLFTRVSGEKKGFQFSKGQPIPSLVQAVSNLGPNISSRPSPHLRLGPMKNDQRMQPQNSQPMPLMAPQSISNLGQVRYQNMVPGESHLIKKHKIYINPRFKNQQIRQQAPQTVSKNFTTQFQKAKLLLEKAKQTQMKQPQPNVGLKRKMAENNVSIPIKIVKTEDAMTLKQETTEETFKSQLKQERAQEDIKSEQAEGSEVMDAESRKLKELLEEQKRKRELIKKQKEMARQKQAAIKRQELEEKKKLEGKNVDDKTAPAFGITEDKSTPSQIVLNSGNVTLTTASSNFVISKRVNTTATASNTAGVASRLGPPPNQLVKPLSGDTRTVFQETQVYRPPLNQGASMQSQQRQSFGSRKIITNNPRPSTSLEGHMVLSSVRPNKPFHTQRIVPHNQPRFSAPSSAPSGQNTIKTITPRLARPPSEPGYKFTHPTNMPPPQPLMQILTSSSLKQDLRYPPSAVQHLSNQPSIHLQPNQTARGHPSTQPAIHHQSAQPVIHHQSAQSAIHHQSSQPVLRTQSITEPYNFHPPIQAFPPQSSQYQHGYTAPPPQYTAPVSSYPSYQNQSHYISHHTASVENASQVLNSTATYPNQQYQSSTPVTYQPPPSQSGYDYYTHTTNSQASMPSLSVSEQSVGQRIQTIGQHVQPTTGGQIRSILQNVQPASSIQHRSEPFVSKDSRVSVYPGPQKIVIYNLPQQATRETIIKICRHFGHVMGVNLMRAQNKAVVQFQTGEQAAKCVSKCDQKCLHKTRLTVQLLP